ncbi:MAG: hypothetical protein MI802_27220 [Desulfobacterales bacterium]|nr:hypothetical protein [Desulfobacterales bacterium]
MFKTCTKCNTVWKTRQDFLTDPGITVSGYQVFFQNLRDGLFLFNHHCGTTIAIEASKLLDLYKGPVYTRRISDGRNCPGKCTMNNIMDPCSKRCRCAFITEIIKEIKRIKKKR